MADPKNMLVAMQLAAIGIPIFPADHRKRPAVADWDAASSADADRVRRWWRIRPTALVGIDLRKAGLLAIDADRHGGPDGVGKFADLLEHHRADLSNNPIVRTPTGGVHVYFAQTPGDTLGNRRGRLPAGIDVRGAGGYVIAPGCVLPDGRAYVIPRRRRDLVVAYVAGDIPQAPPWLVRRLRALNGIAAGRTGAARTTRPTARVAMRLRLPFRASRSCRRTICGAARGSGFPERTSDGDERG